MSTSITWHNIRYQELVSSLADENEEITRNDYLINTKNGELKYKKDLLAVLQNVYAYLKEQNQVNTYMELGIIDGAVQLQDILDRQVYHTDSVIRNIEDTIAVAKNNIDIGNSRIAIIKERIAAIENEQQSITVELTDVKKKLKTFSSIPPRSIKMEQNTDKPIIQFNFNGIISKVDISLNNTPYIKSDFSDIYIPIPPVIVSIRPTNGEITMTGKRSGYTKYSVFTWDEVRAVHPHVLGFKPCLGDFAGPVREAVNDLDWSTVATLLKLFLERIVSNDAAGENWIRYLTGPVNGWFYNDTFSAFNRNGFIKQHLTPGYYTYYDRNGENPIEHPFNKFYFPKLITGVDPVIDSSSNVDTTLNSN
jgi:hypothetical protein